MVKNFTVDNDATSPPKKTRLSGGDHDAAVPQFAMPNTAAATQKGRRPPQAPIQIAFHTFSDDSGLHGFQGRTEEVVAAIYDHGAYPSALFKEAAAKDLFCAENHKADKNFPETGRDFDAQNGLRWVMSSADATFPAVPFRRGMYMKRSKVLWFVDYMDTFFAWRQEKGDEGDYGELSIEVTNATNFKFDKSSKKYECVVAWKDVPDVSQLPFHVMSIPSPAWSRLYPHIKMEPVDATHLNVRCEGDTFSFKSQFNDFNVFGRYEAMDGTPLSEEASNLDKRQGQYVF